uniref:Uncharacterized protein n=1 Tax=Oryza sativa subsp. japonica TaxID=39947 RepID=Q6ZGI7_ORYSJ|nr:hypothetical protein [Oryza sativa Japonica Group]BAD16945.1 hypothetical protein [Oryza sativa Japonica Group]
MGSLGEADGKKENEEEDVGMNYIGAERSGTAGSGSISPELVGEVGAGVRAWTRGRRGVWGWGAGKAEKVGGARVAWLSPARGGGRRLGKGLTGGPHLSAPEGDRGRRPGLREEKGKRTGPIWEGAREEEEMGRQPIWGKEGEKRKKEKNFQGLNIACAQF